MKTIQQHVRARRCGITPVARPMYGLCLLALWIALWDPNAGLTETPTEENWVFDTIAGSGRVENDGDGPAKQRTIRDPFGVAWGPDQSLYITEVGHHRIRRWDPRTDSLTTVAGTGTRGLTGDGGLAIQAALNEPYEVRFDQAGNMFFVEMQNHVIRRVDVVSGQISTVAGTGQAGYSGDGGLATRAAMSQPHSIDLDGDGNIYVADIGNQRVRRIDAKTKIMTSIAGDGSTDFPQDGQLAQGNPLLGPRALFHDQGTLWIALREGHSVWRLDLTSGLLHHVAGTQEKPSQGKRDGVGAEATLNGPKGIVVDRPRGAVYVCDTENHLVRRIDLRSRQVSTIAPRSEGFSEGNATILEGLMNRPHGICVDPEGNIYVGDTLNHRVRILRRNASSGLNPDRVRSSGPSRSGG